MSYEDKHTYDLCGVNYEATRDQANKIMLRVMQTKEWEAYAISKELVANGTFSSTDLEAQRIVATLIVSYRNAFKVTLDIVNQVQNEAY